MALIVVGTNAHMSQRIDPGTYYRQYLKTGIFASRKQDQKLYEVMYDMNEPDLEENSAYFNVDRRFIKLKFIK